MARKLWIIVVVLLSTAYGGSSDEPPCEVTELQSCLRSMLQWTSSRDLPHFIKPFREMTFGERTIRRTCRGTYLATECYRKYAFDCLKTSAPDEVHFFWQRSESALKFCSKTDSYKKNLDNINNLVECNVLLKTNASSTYRFCNARVYADLYELLHVGKVKDVSTNVTGDLPLYAMFFDKDILSNTCSMLTDYQLCLGTIVNDTCGAAASHIANSMMDALLQTYQCDSCRLFTGSFLISISVFLLVYNSFVFAQ